jgi:excinuclease ABC subunit C
MSIDLREKLLALPDRPGVYILKDAAGAPLYIGKALSLRKRVQTYFSDREAHDDRIAAMVGQVADLEFILTETELEALILESNLIKERRPKYNVVLKDDKHYPFLRLDVADPFPMVTVARRVADDGALYFGPYVPATAMWNVLALVNKTFPLRKCPSLRGRTRCLEYHLGRCLAPCEGLVDEGQYREVVDQVRLFLDGKNQELGRLLEGQMREAAERLEFERAARLRDQLASLGQVMEGQRAISARGEDQDAFAVAQQGREAQAQVLIVRAGRLIGREAFAFDGVGPAEVPGLLAGLLKQFYLRRQDLPRQILASELPEDAGLIAEWLSARAGRRVEVHVPQRGRKAHLLEMALANAREALAQSLRSAQGRERALQELQEALELPTLPLRIEAYDISNIQGALAVGSMVVMEGGAPKKSDYKRFRIKTVPGPDDFAMLGEVLRRRLSRAEELPLPDLILIDGGRGQLNVGLRAAEELKIEHLPMVALAKQEELIYHPDREMPLALPEGSRARHLLQHLRDEAHRFGLAYHRKLRGKAGLRSLLDAIPGVGAQRRRQLLQRLGSVRRLRAASPEEIRRLGGVPARVAETIHAYLNAPQVPPAAGPRPLAEGPRPPRPEGREGARLRRGGRAAR